VWRKGGNAQIDNPGCFLNSKKKEITNENKTTHLIIVFVGDRDQHSSFAAP